MSNLPESIVLNTKNHKIESPEGFVDFLGINKISKDSYLHLKFSNGSELKCSTDHPIMTIDGIIRAKNLSKKTEIETKTGGCFVISKRHIKKKIDLYDIVNSGTKHLYYSNNIVSHNCEFLGSASTLINVSKLRNLAFINPIYHDENLDVYEYPIRDTKDDDKNISEIPHIYVMTVDTSRGVGGDYSAFSVFDVSQMPYKQVAKYRSNTIAPILFPNIIYDIAMKYNEAYVLVEINDIGQQVADILHKDLEYDNIFKIESNQKKGQNISAGYKRQIQFGLRTTTKIKRIGCANLKTLIEANQLKIVDFDTIHELSTFIRKKDSYEAEEGNHDDLAMTLVLFGWMVSQGFFKDTTNTDLRKTMIQEQIDMLENEMTPFGFIENGFTPKTFVEDGDIWSEGSAKFSMTNY